MMATVLLNRFTSKLMKTLIAILITAGLCTISHAQVAIYKNKTKGTVTGAGGSQKFTTLGYMVVDLENGGYTRINAYPSKKLEVIYPDFYIMDNGTGKGGKGFMVIQEGASYVDVLNRDVIDSVYMKGSHAVVDVGAASRYQMVKTYTVTGRTTYYSGSGDFLSEESSGTYSLDLKVTKELNLAGTDYDAAITRAIQLLKDQGYTERTTSMVREQMLQSVQLNGISEIDVKRETSQK
jgi:hypothetical protein